MTARWRGGWGWGESASDLQTAASAGQILATTHFRLYRSIGGDCGRALRGGSSRVNTTSAVYPQSFAASAGWRSATNPPDWRARPGTQRLEWAGRRRLDPHQSGASPLARRRLPQGDPLLGVRKTGPVPSGITRTATVEGAPPPVGVYIDDGRHGEYPFQPKQSSPELHGYLEPRRRRCRRRRASGADRRPNQLCLCPDQEPRHDACHQGRGEGLPRAARRGLVYPTDWTPMATPQLTAPIRRT